MSIGCVIYTKNHTTGELTATWSFYDGTDIMEGTGHANGKAGNDYPGEYKITYYDNNKSNIGEYKLIITKAKESYVLEWYQDENQKFTGIALLQNSKLMGGWKLI
jgi:hypothetical protein